MFHSSTSVSFNVLLLSENVHIADEQSAKAIKYLVETENTVTAQSRARVRQGHGPARPTHP
ncbi:hypothetical protein BJV78DRAFT_1223755 [Lactifluus subvellereus]|nr:hypothetical protein BJV78DRAFT_1223755 [Lactifluus subvellereus]